MTNPIFKFALREDLQNEKQFLPARAEPKASGWDVRAAFPNRKALIVHPLQHIKIPLGIRSFCPDGWWYELKPRSSTFAKKALHALYGTIDETYEGELIFACQFIPNQEYTEHKGLSRTYYQSSSFEHYCEYNRLVINFGDAIGQLIPKKRDEMTVEEVSIEEYDLLCKNRASVRGEGGFGSTENGK